MLAVCGESWENKVALDPSGATYFNDGEQGSLQFDRIAEAGLMAFDQFPLLQIDNLNVGLFSKTRN
jgi:hypothetical protein